MNISIQNLLVNRLHNPLGFSLGKTPRLNWIIQSSYAADDIQTCVVVATDPEFKSTVFDSGFLQNLSGISFTPALPALMPQTRYYWRVQAKASDGEAAVSETAWFETAKLEEPWTAQWISPDFPEDWHPILYTDFAADKQVQSARAYICGLGLYEASLNGEKVGDEYLSPGLCAYDKWLPYQTYDVTGMLSQGKNRLEVMLGNGWYKGRYGLKRSNPFRYGDAFALILEMHITYTDGSTETVVTDTNTGAQSAARCFQAEFSTVKRRTRRWTTALYTPFNP